MGCWYPLSSTCFSCWPFPALTKLKPLLLLLAITPQDHVILIHKTKYSFQSPLHFLPLLRYMTWYIWNIFRMEKLSQLVGVLARRDRYLQTRIMFLTCNERRIPQVSKPESLAYWTKYIFAFLIDILRGVIHLFLIFFCLKNWQFQPSWLGHIFHFFYLFC